MLRLLGLQSLPPSCFDAAVAVLLLCLFPKVLSACEIPIVITVTVNPSQALGTIVIISTPFLINLSGFHLNWCVSTSFLFSHDSKFLGLESGNFHFFDIGSFPIPQAHQSFTFVAIRNTLLNCFDFIAPRQAWQPGWAQWA